jgi:HK97 family phage prohead protease
MSAATMERERLTRSFPLKNVEFRDTPDGGLRITGHAAVFGKPSVNLGGYTERIKRGAFKKVLASSPDVPLLQNHDYNRILARTSSGSLTLREDPEGLYMEAIAGDTSYARDLRVMMQRGDVSECSFAFLIGDAVWDKESTPQVRETTEVSFLYDVSIVSAGAFPQTDATMRSRQDAERYARRAESLTKAERGLAAARDAREEL